MESQPEFLANTIVVVDDSEIIALCVKTMLAIEGYRATDIFDCPEKALDEIRKRGCPAFIITDFEMPLMTGDAFLESVEQLYPEVRGVIVTGHNAVPAEVCGRFHVIRKDDPDFFGRLLREVRDGLAP